MILELYLGVVNYSWDSKECVDQWSGWKEGYWRQFVKPSEYNWINLGIDIHIEYEAYLATFEVYANILGLGFTLSFSTPETEKSRQFKERLKQNMKDTDPDCDDSDFRKWDEAGID